MLDCSPAPTPLPLQLDKTAGQQEAFSNPTYFRSLAGKLQYLTLTRPDIQFAVNFVCQKMSSPTMSDFLSDSDWAGCKVIRRSTGGYCTFLGNNLISWSSKKQPTVAKSSTEAEYRSMSNTASKLTWISLLLKELRIPLTRTPELHCDNLSAVYLTANPAFHARSKHFENHYHYVRERVALGALLVRHIPSHLQIADIFTKSLPIQTFIALRYKLGAETPPTPSLRGAISGASSISGESKLTASSEPSLAKKEGVCDQNDDVLSNIRDDDVLISDLSTKHKNGIVSTKKNEAKVTEQYDDTLITQRSSLSLAHKTEDKRDKIEVYENPGKIHKIVQQAGEKEKTEAQPLIKVVKSKDRKETVKIGEPPNQKSCKDELVLKNRFDAIRRAYV